MDSIHKVLNYQYACFNFKEYIDKYKRILVNHIQGIEIKPNYFKIKDLGNINNIIEFICIQHERPTPEQDVCSRYITDDCLWSIIHDYNESSRISSQNYYLIYKFQNKFENFHRLCSSYNTAFRVINTHYKSTVRYTLLNLLLIIDYSISNNFNSLNTSLKIVDLLINFNWSKTNLDVILTYLCLDITLKSISTFK